MKLKIYAFILAVLMLLTSCSSNEQVKEGDAQIEITEEKDLSKYYSKAEFLTEKIIISMSKESFEEGVADFETAKNLLVFLVPTTEEALLDTRNPYMHLTYLDEMDRSHFPKEECERVIYEVFGFEDYEFFLDYSDAYFDEAAQEYIMTFGFGLGGIIQPSEIKAETEDGKIKVNFVASKTENVNGDPVLVAFGDYSIYFEVMQDEQGEFLRCTEISGVEYPGASVDLEKLCANAEYLAERIIGAFHEENFEGTEFTDEVVTRFLVYLANPSGGNNYDKHSPYVKNLYLDESGWHLPKAECERIAFEVLGVENFEMKLPEGSYDAEKKEYFFKDINDLDLNFGRGQSLWNDGAITVYSNEHRIEVEFGILKPGDDENPGWQEMGQYKMGFDIMHGENGKYLRFDSVEKIPAYETVNLDYPENRYNMHIENFINRTNDKYIDYLYNIAKATNYKSKVGIDKDYKGFDYEDLGGRISSAAFFNVFAYAVEDISAPYYEEDPSKATVPVGDVMKVLDKYFEVFEFYGNKTSIESAEFIDQRYIEIPAETGIPYVIAYDRGGYRIDSVTDNGDGTVTAVIITNEAEEINNEFVPTGKDLQSHTLVFEPQASSCHIISYKVENLL